MELLHSPELLLALLPLTVLEIVLGIDNMIFITILASKLPEEQQRKARLIGLAGAMLTRIALLFSLSWIMTLTTPVFTALSHAFSWRDLILVGGGAFLVYKSVTEIYEKLEGNPHEKETKVRATLLGTVMQIMVIDIVFSLDSVITAVGMVNNLTVMIAAIVIAVVVMMLSSDRISTFVQKHPSIKVLALSFLLMIGVLLGAEGFGQHFNKGYVYFAMAFSFVVELLNLRLDEKKKAR